MTSPSETKPTTGQVLFGLGILLLILAIAIGMFSLGNPYYAIVQVALFADALILSAFRLKECFQVAKDSPYTAKLQGITLFLILGTLPIVSHLKDVIQSDDRNYIQLALNVCLYFALLFALDLVAALLKKTKSSKSDAASLDNASTG